MLLPLHKKYNEFANSDPVEEPVDIRDTGFGYHLGFDTKLYYSNNAPSASSGIGRGISGHLGKCLILTTSSTGAFDLGGAVFSPIISLNLLEIFSLW